MLNCLTRVPRAGDNLWWTVAILQEIVKRTRLLVVPSAPVFLEFQMFECTKMCSSSTHVSRMIFFPVPFLLALLLRYGRVPPLRSV